MERICKNITLENLETHKKLYGILYTQKILAGKWKLAILWFLREEKQRYNEIKRFLGDISQGSLTKQLRELEDDEIISRKVYPEVPPRVEYFLTDKGKKLISIFNSII
ncbi:MAG: helix-turn-helix transcriptional regulator [Fusobacterium sp.]|nr:helix-turn-helix transcriptional regulator [Fusobacterium sp.]